MILVTGGTGVIGGELVRLLAARDVAFRALVRRRESAEALDQRGVPTVSGDFADAKSLDAAMRGATSVFLLTPPVEDQAQLQAQAIRTAKAAGVQYLVKISAVGASPTSPAKLGRDHAEAEQATKDCGIAYTILRPHSFMQNLLGMAQTIAAKGEFYGAAGRGRIAMVDARDIALVAAHLLTSDASPHHGQTYELTGPDALSFGDAAAILTTALGREIRYVDLKGEELKAGLTQFGLPDWLAEDLVTLHTIYKAGHGAAVSHAVERIIGEPARPFSTFVTDHQQAFQGAA